MRQEPAVVLLVDDDPDDCFLLQDAFKRIGDACKIVCLDSGDLVLDYLKFRGPFRSREHASLPSLILLDLNMPRKDGRQILRELKEDPDLRGIPVVVLTTSCEESDVRQSYDSGASSFISKPDRYEDLQKMVSIITQYWLGLVRLPY